MNAMSAGSHGGLKVLAAALVIGASAAPVQAQAVQDSAVTTTTTHTEEREGGFPWGLLGLLGLAGLLGRGKKQEVHHETVRPVETHRAAPHTTTGTVTDRTVIRPDETGGTHGGTTGGGTRL